MSQIYLTPKILPDGHTPYAVIDTIANTCHFTSDLNRIGTLFNPALTCWNMKFRSLQDLLNHPDIISFTYESHPEFFI